MNFIANIFAHSSSSPPSLFGRYDFNIITLVSLAQILYKYKCLIELHNVLKCYRYHEFCLVTKIRLNDQIKKFDKKDLRTFCRERPHDVDFFDRMKNTLEINLANNNQIKSTYTNFDYIASFNQIFYNKIINENNKTLIINNGVLLSLIFVEMPYLRALILGGLYLYNCTRFIPNPSSYFIG